MFAVTLCLLMMFAALATGFVAGEAAELPVLRRRFWIGYVISTLIALAGLALMALNLSSIRSFLATEAAKRIPDSAGPLRSAFQLRPEQIPVSVLWLLAALFFLLTIFLFLLAFNCRRRAENRWFACGWIVLFGAIFFFTAIWGFYGLSTFIVMLRSYSQTFPTLGSVIACIVLTAVILAGWTFFALRNQKKGWRRLFAHAGIIAGIYAETWLLGLAVTYPYGLYALHCAKVEEIQPWHITSECPPELMPVKEEIDRFYQEHDDFSLPVASIYSWTKQSGSMSNKPIPENKREYTLQLFDSPESEKLLASYEKLIRNSDSDAINLTQLNYSRSYARIRAGRAALYSETGQPEKILPELRKAAEIDFGQNNTQGLLNELVRIACRSIWLSPLMNIGPDGPEYAPFYREMLTRLKSCRVRIPDDSGYFLPQLEAGLHFKYDATLQSVTSAPGSYAVILSTPARIAVAAGGFLNSLSQQKTWPGLERREVFETAPGNDEFPDDKRLTKAAKSLALRSRASLVLGTTGLALKLYRSEKGHYPQKLEELVPEYLAKLPPCPFTGKPLHYESDGTNFELCVADPEQGKHLKLNSRKDY